MKLVKSCCVEGSAFGLPLIDDCGFSLTHSIRYFGFHTHKTMEIFFVLEGNVPVETKESGFRPLRGGHFTIFVPGHEHRPYNDIITPSKSVCLNLMPPSEEIMANSCFSLENYRHIFHSLCNDCTTARITAKSTKLLRSFIKILSDPLTPDSIEAAELRCVICELMLDIYNNTNAVNKVKSDKLVESAKGYMQENFTKQITMPQIAAKTGYEVSWLHKHFKNVTGSTPGNYLQELRIENAKKLLVESNMPLTAIAFESGFTSSQYFAFTFKRYTDQTPGQFRKQYRDKATGSNLTLP